ncbi:MAG TPA: hypothetical protein VMU15_13380 [Anaeromyxobacter sp.]|nr:hypothetical protein [Anaeromyxobacter sp.]
MKRALEATALIALLAVARSAQATPSTVVWTPATTYTQPFLVPHLDFDTYFAEQNALQIDNGILIGVLPFEKLQGEIGADLFYPGGTANYLQLNGKLTLPEGAFGLWSPGVSAGIQSAGFKKDVSDYHLLHADIGKTFDKIGTFTVGGYYGAGSKLLWTGSDGKVNRAGFEGSYVSPDITVNLTGLNKLNLMADIATGRNWYGAISAGLEAYFTPAIGVIAGPVFFQDTDLYKAMPHVTGDHGATWMWTMQLDVDFDLRPAKPAEAPKS